MENDYFLGLDLGTGSLGWAVTNEQYEIQRAHGKALWGVRLFETAKTAEERRVNRTNRRRLARRNWPLAGYTPASSLPVTGLRGTYPA